MNGEDVERRYLGQEKRKTAKAWSKRSFLFGPEDEGDIFIRSVGLSLS
jgi:hypothetical protein